MLNRLESTQEQTVWWALWDKVCNPGNLDAAIRKVIVNQGSAGVDHQTTHQLAREWGRNRNQLLEELLTGKYQQLPV
jgi:hypothetical protein